MVSGDDAAGPEEGDDDFDHHEPAGQAEVAALEPARGEEDCGEVRSPPAPATVVEPTDETPSPKGNSSYILQVRFASSIARTWMFDQIVPN